ncbi:hypothetical protein CC1G_14129 [Coprinopsis cinerea okayama7|uniref:Uncharacterized protein n=1 Tax=Coprinopsis cinerea (strain Okayama-7 / 130 / ATCC MYA-4618 / FGSC 9003) TaxID=240176 RepID=D6RLB4_COPC7|nr:hypothetical protein CC1G_14129 [Coprinopsis cinerea okayama7\|eukprot:XP_002911596.1 hypothetical protein CC1G_14129 [Coprinopsis cinerea okayama7\
MDIAISIVAGLSLRTFLVGKNVAFVWLSPAVIGAFEGVVVHQLSSRSNSEVDHFLAFGLRLIIDHLLSGDTSRTVMIVVWTAIGFITSEVVTPRTTLEPLPPIKRERSERRYRSSRTTGTSSRIRAYQSPTSTDTLLTRARTTPTPVIPTRLPGLRPSNTPRIPVHRPPSPPSTFLRDGSDTLSPIPPPLHPLELSPTRPPTGLAVCLEADSGGSTPSPKGVLPTPPQSAPSENVDYTTRETGSPRRLSTIQEISSDQEMSPRTRRTNSGSRALEPEVPVQPPPPPSQPAVAAPAPSGSRPSQSGASSEKGNHTRPGSPLPVPNLTLDGFALSQPFKPDDEIQHSTPYSQTMQSAPVPVPNLTTSNWQPCAGSQAAQEDGDLLSPLSDGPEFGARHARNPQDPPTEELLSPLSDGPEFGASHSRGASAPPRTPDPDDLLSPVSEGEEFDELRTPPPRGYKRGTSGKGKGKASSSNIRVPQEISDDPLRTPPELRSPEAFSPLLVDEPLASGSKTPPARLGSTSTSHTRTFGNPTGFQPFAAIDTGFDLDLEPPSIPGSMPSPVAPLPPQGDQNDDDEAHGGPPSDPETVLSNATSILSTRKPKSCGKTRGTSRRTCSSSGTSIRKR